MQNPPTVSQVPTTVSQVHPDPLLSQMDDYWKAANAYKLPTTLLPEGTKLPPTAPVGPIANPSLTNPSLTNPSLLNPNMPINPNVPFNAVDLSLLGLPTGRHPHYINKDGAMRDMDVGFEQTVSMDLLRHKTYQAHELGQWPQVDLIIQGDLLFILIDAAGFDLASYFFEESAPNVLHMIGRKTALATFPELKNAHPELWKLRQRPLGDSFEFNIDLNEVNFRLDPSTLTYANYNGCMVYRGLREPMRPLQIFRYK